jgi:thioredoxin 1
MSGATVAVKDSDFEEQVIKSDLPVLVDFWAEWCGPCKMVAPVVEDIAGSMSGRLKVCKLNVDENPITAQSFGIRAIPTLILFKDGQTAARIVGVRSKADLEAEIEAAIK